jgi:dATP pyrophosphohydrolase
VVYTRTGKVLLLQRADDPDFWQSVTGSLLWEETEPRQAAARELREETGFEATEDLRNLQLTYRYPILPRWRPRYAPDVRENTEHAFALELTAEILITVNPAEHAGHAWFTMDEAMAKVASWTNREVILKLKPGD